MSLRQKILLMFSLTIVLTVGAVEWAASVRLRVLFDAQNRDRAAALVNQFVREYERRAGDITGKVERLAHDGRVLQMDNDLAHANDTSAYANEAGMLAREYGLDFLELVESDGTVLSSAQSPARVGAQDASAAVAAPSAYLKTERLAGDKNEIGVFASRAAQTSEGPGALTVVGGQRLDKAFIAPLSPPAGSMLYLYRNLSAAFEENNVTGANGTVANAARFHNVVDQVRSTGTQVTSEILRRNSEEQSVALTGVPLKAVDGSVAAVLIVANSRESLTESQEHIRAVAYGVAAIGILFAVMVSLWIAASVSRPLEQLIQGAHDVAAGDWNVVVPVRSSAEEIATLGLAFNAMTRELVRQREQVIQGERVGAYRELAGRVAPELNNRLTPLQRTLENMTRAKQDSPESFRTAVGEAVTTLRKEVASLEEVITQLNVLSDMPKPVLSPIDLRDVIEAVVQPFRATLRERGTPIRMVSEMPANPLPVEGDAELLHRALSSLVLNAIDAMSNGGTLTLAGSETENRVKLNVGDSGKGMTEQEAARVFTPRFITYKDGLAPAQDGLALAQDGPALAMVQAIIVDHHGTVAVESGHGGGTTFRIELPKAPAQHEDHT